MGDDDDLTVNVPKFNEEQYLFANPDAREAVAAGEVRDGYQHYLRYGIDQNRRPQLKRLSTPEPGNVERVFVSSSGFFLILGWLSDEGRSPARCKLIGGDFSIDIPPTSVLRHARKDIESQVREGAFDFGFLIIGKCPSRVLLQRPFVVQADSDTGSFQTRVTPDTVSDKRLLDAFLTLIATTQSHSGKEAALHGFFSGAAGRAVVDLFSAHVADNVASHYAQTFRPRPVQRTFITVLFGSVEAMLLQPVLFRRREIDFGEWIYVCNSPEDANAALRLGKLMSDLYDVMITVIIMPDNVGFGAANNVAVGHASSESIYILNPDVFPLPGHAEVLRRTLQDRDLGSALWGGLLFYDEHNLMHSGMYLDWDTFCLSNSFHRPARTSATSCELARVEHYDKGVPFEATKWTAPRVVPAVTGALMAFRKPQFEHIGGFSTRYIYGHYEDADLSLRWAESNGTVLVDPGLRFIHLEGQGSRARGENYRGAAMTNRYLFSLRHGRARQAAKGAEPPPSHLQLL